MAKKITKKAENTAKKEVETTELTVGVVEPIKENETNVESVSTEVTSLQEEIKTEIENEIQEESNEIHTENEKIEQDFLNVVDDITNRLVEETKKKDDFLKQFENDSIVKTEDELRETLEKEIERVDAVIKEVSNKNNVPLTTYYWNGTTYNI